MHGSGSHLETTVFDSWNHKEFDALYNIFEEDEPDSEEELKDPKDKGGLDKGELLKFIKRIGKF